MYIVELSTNGWKEVYGPFNSNREAHEASRKLVEYRQKHLSAPLRGHYTFSTIIEVKQVPADI